jgi:protein-disulfide isomerase
MSESNPENENAGNITIKKSTYDNMLKGLIAAIAIATFIGGYSLGTLDNSNSGVSSEQLKEILSDIKPTPTPAAQPSQPSAPAIIKVSLDDDPVKGNPNAPVTVVEFSDFQCPFCSKFYKETLSQLDENYIATGKVKLVYRDMPIDSLHPNARTAHIAAECADEKGKFWEFHNMLFEKQAEWQRLPAADLQSTLNQYATDLGLQSASFESCMKSQEIADEINKDSLDSVLYGATGTPTFFIGNEKDGFIKLVGAKPYTEFKAVIDSQLG